MQANLNLFAHVVLLVMGCEDIKLTVRANVRRRAHLRDIAKATAAALGDLAADPLFLLVEEVQTVALAVLQYKDVSAVVGHMATNPTAVSLLSGLLVCVDAVRLAKERGLVVDQDAEAHRPAVGELITQTSASQVLLGSFLHLDGGAADERRSKLREAQVAPCLHCTCTRRANHPAPASKK